MKRVGRYSLEFGLIAAVMLIMVLGFWDIYFGADADAQPHHHLHITTVFIWIGLLLTQLILMARGSYGMHRKVGLAVLVAGPLLVATTAMLSVHSAHKGVVSGEGDFLIIQNVMVNARTGPAHLSGFPAEKSQETAWLPAPEHHYTVHGHRTVFRHDQLCTPVQNRRSGDILPVPDGCHYGTGHLCCRRVSVFHQGPEKRMALPGRGFLFLLERGDPITVDEFRPDRPAD